MATTPTTVTQESGAPVMDVTAMLRSTLLESMNAAGEFVSPDETPDEAAADPEAAATEEAPAADEPATEEPTEADDGATDDTDSAELIKNPEAFVAAHEQMKTKLTKRTEVLRTLAEKLGVTDLNQVTAALDAKLSEAPAVESAGVMLEPTVHHPLSNVNSEADLKAAEDFWRAELKWTRENAGGGERPARAGEQPAEWTIEQVAARQDLALRVLGEGLPQRRSFIGEFRQSAERAQQTYPFLAANSALHKDADAFASDLMQRVPELSQHPLWPEIVSKAFTGHLLETGKYGAAKKEGKVVIVALAGSKPPAAPVKKTPPPNRAAGSTPPAHKSGPGHNIASALEAGDIKGALKAHLDTLAA